MTPVPPDLPTARSLARGARDRAGQATSGPWRPLPNRGRVDDRGWPMQASILTGAWPEGGWNKYGFSDDDAAFIASARQDVPTLANLVDSLADEVDRLRAEAARSVNPHQVYPPQLSKVTADRLRHLNARSTTLNCIHGAHTLCTGTVCEWSETVLPSPCLCPCHITDDPSDPTP